jgi:hypothetical protein
VAAASGATAKVVVASVVIVAHAGLAMMKQRLRSKNHG